MSDQLTLYAPSWDNQWVPQYYTEKYMDLNDLEYVRAAVEQALTLEGEPELLVHALEILDAMIAEETEDDDEAPESTDNEAPETAVEAVDVADAVDSEV